ncbi:MAG: GNAT family N-acetyltransferase [Proteobacteria bacterium]|nr:GNAT family N-acetyltransferase [Pseudomonadota bacterium]
MIARPVGTTASVGGAGALGGEAGGLVAGTLEVRLAVTAAEIDAAQALRYRVFYEEMNARATPAVSAHRRDSDGFDAYCDHLLVIDHKRGSGAEAVVGTYRLLRRSVAGRHGGFYTATEFDVAKLVAHPGEILELGRSCVDAAYRTRPTMQLLWKGIARYVLQHSISLMFGCASLPGTEPQAIAQPLSYLYHYHLAPPHLRARALPDRYVEMNMLPPGEIDDAAAIAQLSVRAALAALPPLIKGYLRLGGLVGEGAVIDHQFNTTDVCIIVVTDRVTDKYFHHYLRQVGGGED